MTDTPPRFRGLIDPPIGGTIEQIEDSLAYYREMAKTYPLDFNPAIEELEEDLEVRAIFEARRIAREKAEAEAAAATTA